jgi:hypothetical protein
MNMAYYVQLSPDANGLFGSGVTKTSIINSLKSNGVSDPKDFAKLDLAVGSNRVLFDSRYTLLLGTDKTSRAQIGTDLMKFFGDAVDEIHLRVPRLNEWLACVTFVDPRRGQRRTDISGGRLCRLQSGRQRPLDAGGQAAPNLEDTCVV